MRGSVQIWQGGELLLEEPNMIVDGAGEILADIMTISPSVSALGIPTSSILDTSNYNIQAISFGTGQEAWNNNAHILTEEEVYENTLGLIGIHTHGPMVGVIWDRDNKGGSFVPEVGIPVAPDPMMRTLEHPVNVSANFAGSGATLPVSSVLPGNGQHINILPSGIFSSVFENTDFSALSSANLAAATLGAFPVGSSTEYTTATYNGLFYPTIDLAGYKNAQTQNYGYFNEVSSMDMSGFVTMIMSATPNDTHDYELSSPASGLIIDDKKGDPEGVIAKTDHWIEYSVELAGGDVATVNMFGGIYHLGLWCIDLEESLRAGNNPPFEFSVLDNPRKYKLFCRKGFSKNLCEINDGPGGSSDDGFKNYSPLLIKWRLYFT
jgi:hypothetical protein